MSRFKYLTFQENQANILKMGMKTWYLIYLALMKITYFDLMNFRNFIFISKLGYCIAILLLLS